MDQRKYMANIAKQMTNVPSNIVRDLTTYQIKGLTSEQVSTLDTYLMYFEKFGDFIELIRQDLSQSINGKVTHYSRETDE